MRLFLWEGGGRYMIILTCSFKPQPVSSIPFHQFIVFVQALPICETFASSHLNPRSLGHDDPAKAKQHEAFERPALRTGTWAGKQASRQAGRQTGRAGNGPPPGAVHLVFFSLRCPRIQSNAQPRTETDTQHPTPKKLRRTCPVGQRPPSDRATTGGIVPNTQAAKTGQ